MGGRLEWGGGWNGGEVGMGGRLEWGCTDLQGGEVGVGTDGAR